MPHLYYAANFDPEVHRLLSAYERGDTVSAELFKEKIVTIIQKILTAPDISPAGTEEWNIIAGLIETYDSNSAAENALLAVYGAPFSMRFALSQ